VLRVLLYSINVLLSASDSPTAFSIANERRDRFNPPWINSRLFRNRRTGRISRYFFNIGIANVPRGGFFSSSFERINSSGMVLRSAPEAGYCHRR